MAARELVLLSPYRYPAHQPLTLADADMAAWLNGYTGLWHPGALAGASAPPRVESAHEHENPRANFLYAVPSSPSSLLPHDWEERLRVAGSVAFRATADRDETLANFKAALPPGTGSVAEAVAPFLGIGMGYLLLSTLSEAMEHQSLLEVNPFWEDVQQAAVASQDQCPQADFSKMDQRTSNIEQALQAAAAKLLAAREALYPVTIHLLDIVSLEDQEWQNPWPVTVVYGQPINVIASASALEKLNRDHPDLIASLAEAIKNERAEVCGGSFVEREDPLLPVESQLWNLHKGLTTSRELLGSDVRVFARRRFGADPQLPTRLAFHGLNRAVLFPTDDAGLPAYSSPVLSWSTQDGQQIECFVRKPLDTGSVDAFFNLGHYFFKTTREDHTATLAFLHGKGPALPWYTDLLELSRFAAVAGQWTTFTHYFGQATAGDHAGNLGADDIHFSFLTEHLPISAYAHHVRRRRRIDSCWTLAAMHRALAGRDDLPCVEKSLQELEDEIEQVAPGALQPEVQARLEETETQIASKLADRLLVKAENQQPGYLVLNSCSFTRRLALEFNTGASNMAVGGPVKAVQLDGEASRVVVEVPGLGFAWLPQSGSSTSYPPASRMRLADERCVRNEFFEAEIDPMTGGLRAIRDHKTLVNRVSERLVFRPGSVMKAVQIKTNSSGPALGEIVTEGVLLGPQDQMLAKFRQRFRAWLGRPILDLRIELYPEQPAAGDPWHAYYGAQFAWRDERAQLIRGLGGLGHVTTHLRPQTPDYLEIRQSRQRTTIFPCGLPFHQREGGRMLDVILLPPGESCQVFDLAVGLDREQPMQTALGLVTPATVVATAKGPPHVGTKGWLFHLDAPNLLMTSMRPGGQELRADGSGFLDLPDAVTVRLLECAGFGTSAELRCVRNPVRVELIDGWGKPLTSGTHQGDAALFHAGAGNLLQLQVQFSV
jgi:hypothetical protein